MTVIYIYCVNCMKFGQLILRKIIQIVTTGLSHFKAENAPNLISAAAPPQTPLEELTALTQTPSCI